MKRQNSIIAILIAILVFAGSASLNSPAEASSCASSKLYGEWRTNAFDKKPGDKFDKINFYYTGGYCQLAMSIDGQGGIKMTRDGDSRLVSIEDLTNGYIHVTVDYRRLDYIENAYFKVTIVRAGYSTYSYSQKFSRLRLR